MKRITVFGGSAPKPGEPAYEQALRLGTLLGSAGYTVLTGGYIGTMEAVSRGAAEAGAYVIGVTCEEIEAWRPVNHNPWVQEEMRYATLRQRIFALIETCDGAVALPGGAGTLTEIATMWNHLVVHAIEHRPLILVGPEWRAAFDKIFQVLGNYVPLEQRGWLSFAADVDEAFEQLQHAARTA